jgi:hypothetical protein
MLRRTTVAAALLCTAAAAQAAEKTNLDWRWTNATIYGIGAKPCGTEWVPFAVNAADKTIDRELRWRRMVDEHWVLGYLSGVARTLSVYNDIDHTDAKLAPLDVGKMVEYLDDFCRAHPLAVIEAAADAFVKTLLNRK